MASIWCCQATVHTKEPMNVPGLPESTTFSVPVKVRIENEKEPSDSSIIAQARELMNKCYTAEVLDVTDPHVNFILWEKV